MIEIIYCAFFLALCFVFIIDIKSFTIPFKLCIFIAFLGILKFITQEMSLSGFVNIIIGCFAVSLPMLALAVVYGAVGGGDVKLFAALGLFFGWKLIILCAVISFLLGGLFSAILIIIKKRNIKDAVPFGPFISISAIFTAVFGNAIIDWYAGLV
ncbi:MAG: A24 family peptidase [Clostridiales bacterium]|jgi:leader peptidase (prepilin peptidase)/N-methyltransferase|nr:A24 family peptidase [Clostridiales bacterium]